MRNIDSVKEKLKHFTHPRAFKVYKDHQSNLIKSSGESVTSINVRNHIVYNAMIAEKDSSIIESTLESSVKLLKSAACPLTASDRIHCLLELSLLNLKPSNYEILRDVTISLLKNSELESLTDQSILDSFML